MEAIAVTPGMLLMGGYVLFCLGMLLGCACNVAARVDVEWGDGS